MIVLPFNYRPVQFHPYTSRTLQRIIEMELNDETEVVRKQLVEEFNDAGIKAWDDNKIVFECEIDDTKVYYGFYDLKFSIGLDYQDENERVKFFLVPSKNK